MAKACRFRKKNGQRCDFDAQLGKDVCVFHDPERADDGPRARRAGGVSRTRLVTVLPSDTPGHSLKETRDVSNLLGDSINQLRRGQLDPKVANSIGCLASVLLRALEQGPMEERLAKLESILMKNAATSELFDFKSRTNP